MVAAGVPTLARLSLGLGLACLLLAIAWWGTVFPSVSSNTGLTLPEVLPCLAVDSGMCRLGLALCGSRHFLGLAGYSPALFWTGAGLLSLASVLAALRSR